MKPKYLEVEVAEGVNSPMEIHRMFSVKIDPRPVTSVFTSTWSGADCWCDVTGWSNDGPCQAYVATVEDSGDGQAILIYGGDQGIRLKPVENKSAWNLETKEQWGEPCLLLPLETEVR